MTMKAISLQPGTTNLKLSDWPEPQITHPQEIKVKIVRVGICGTDREETGGGRADAPAGETRLIIGHEMLGKVVEVGKLVTKVKPGDYAVFTVRRSCGRCTACLNHRNDMCFTGQYTERGIKGRHGYQAQYAVDLEEYAVKVPEHIADVAVLTEPMSVVEKAIDEAGLIQTARLGFIDDKQNWLKGKRALVAGLGPIGLLAAVVLSLRGAEVLGLDVVPPNSPRVALLEQMGGTYINDKNVKLEAFQRSYPDISLIVEAAGIAKLDFDLLQMLGINGVYVLTGVPGDQRPVDVDGSGLMRQLVLKNQAMVGSVNASPDHFQMALKDLEAAFIKWPGLLQKMITAKIPFQKFQDPLTHHNADEIKVTIEW